MQGKIFTIFLAIALISVAVFGFLGMGVIGGEMAHTCPFSALLSSDCSLLETTASLAAHHFTALQNLSWELASFDILSLVFSSLLFLLAFALFSARFIFNSVVLPAAIPVFVKKPRASARQARVLRWLARHNKCDFLAPVRVCAFAL